MKKKKRPFRPMLAATLEAGDDRHNFPMLASPKLDGIRCIIWDSKALSRALKPIPNKFIRGALEDLGIGAEGLDGEIMLPYPAKFQAVSSMVMSHDKKPPKDWYYAVFDRVPYEIEGSDEFPFHKRCDEVERTVMWHRNSPKYKNRWAHVQHLKHYKLNTVFDMLSFEETAVTLHGHEGIMLRSMDGPYKFGRSTEREGYLLKVKRFTDGEAVIIGMEELYHNKNEAFTGELGQTKRRGLQENMVAGGIMGKLCVRDLKTGVEFNIGTGYTALQRKVWWRLRSKMKGRIVKYRFQEHGVKNKPRIASFVGFRDPRDMWNSTNQQ